MQWKNTSRSGTSACTLHHWIVDTLYGNVPNANTVYSVNANFDGWEKLHLSKLTK